MPPRDPRRPPPKLAPLPSPPVRTLLLAVVAIAVSIWAIVRAYTPPRRAPAPAPPATEIPAPSVIEAD